MVFGEARYVMVERMAAGAAHARLGITGRLAALPDGSALVAGGLELLEVQPEGKKRMAAADYLRGLRR